MGLKIWGPEGKAPAKKAAKFADDVVGRFRSGYQASDRPVALTEWRVTSGDPEALSAVADLLGGDEPKGWDAKGEDNLEVFTTAPAVDIVLDGPDALRQSMILWGRNGKVIRRSDGETISYPPEMAGQPDPQADQTLAERKAAARQGTGAEPQVELFFRLADAPDLGKFKFQSASWSLVSDIAYHGVEEDIAAAAEQGDGRVAASLSLEEVSFTAKSGPRAGQTVSFVKPVITVQGPAA